MLRSLFALSVFGALTGFQFSEIGENNMLQHDKVDAGQVYGGACYDDGEDPCLDPFGACGDSQCEDADPDPTVVRMECPENTSGLSDFQESVDNCVEDEDGPATGRNETGEETDPCWKFALCRKDNCVQATNLAWYCSNGPNTPRWDDNSRNTKAECVGNNCQGGE